MIPSNPWTGLPLPADPDAEWQPESVLGNAPQDRLTALAAACSAPAARQQGIALLVDQAGKTVADATAEIDLLGRKVAVTLEALGRTPAPGAAADGSPQIHWRPRGLAVVLGPFNFPLHLLHGLVVPALATGNPVIAKVSERTPGLAGWYRERIHEAGLADHCAVTCGDGPAAGRLIANPRTATVALVGSRTTAAAISRALMDRPEVVFAAEMGGVNPALICADADLPAAAAAISDGAFRMAGQRCTATRMAWVPANLRDRLVDLLLIERQRWLTTGDATGPLGPLISRSEREKVRTLLTGRPSDWSCHGGEAWGHAGLQPTLLIAGRSPWPDLDHEVFAPVLRIHAYTDEAAAVSQLAANPARLAAAVWTADREHFSRRAPRLPYGQVYHNRNTAGARSDLPFGGCGHSGNGHPAALSAARIFADECVVW